MAPRRAFRVALIAGVALVILIGAFLWALPEIVRRVALDQIPKRTGRAAAIEDVDLNLFTGRLAIKKLRLDERESTTPFVELERLEVRLSLMALLRSDIRLTEVTVVAPSVRVVRTGPAEFNFSDLLQPSQPATGPSRWTFSIDRLTLARGAVRAHDRVVSPAADWVVRDLGVEAAGITTRPNAAPGRLTVHAVVDEAALDVTADPLRLEPLQVGARVGLDRFEVRRLVPYVFVPLGTPYTPLGGRLALALDAHVDSDADEVKKATLSGTVTVQDEALAQTGHQEPFLAVSRLAVQLKEADALTRSLTVASVSLEGLDLKARRDARGAIDLMALLGTRPGPAPAAARAGTPVAAADAPQPPSPAPPGERKLGALLRALARGFEQIRVERVTLEPSTATIVDESVKPVTTLALTKLQASLGDLTWPVKGPASLALSTELPGGGTLAIKGPVIVQPFDADLTFAVRDAPVQPYQAYIPVPARLAGRFGGDSRNRIAVKDGGMVLASKGNSWATDVEIRAPGGDRPVIRVPRMELTGIDFDWPKRASVARAAFRRPAADIERAADGSINVRRLFTPNGAPAPGPEASALPAAVRGEAPRAPDRPKSLLETMQLDFKEIRIEQGSARFLDRTTQPAFSQDLSRLEVTVTNLNNRPGERARLALQSVVGGADGLDIRGEIGSLGSPAFVDLVGELRSFKLASVDPYTASAIGWVIKKGELQYKVRFKLDGGELAATNDVVVGHLQVAPAAGGDEVKQRLGLPLGLIVALLKDSKGEIRANVPVTGSIADPKFDLSETIWTAIKNVLTNIVAAPFRAIGRLFSSGEKMEEPKVDAVTFAAGSAVLSPDMEEHLLRVADFLRRSPFVNLALAATANGADAEALKADAVAEHLRDFQKERALKDGPAAVAAYFKERLPDVPLPATGEEQLARLREGEPLPEALLADLARRRIEVTRERLVTAEGIPPERLTTAEPKAAAPAPADGSGRVEFAVIAGAE
jgi:hypothetical protein